MFYILFIVYLVVSTFSIKSMEVQVAPTNTSKSKKSFGPLKRSKSFKGTDKTITRRKIKNNNIPPVQQEDPFIIAAKSNDVITVKNFLNNPDFNPNTGTSTAFHICIRNHYYLLLEVLLSDPRVDTTVVDEHGQIGHNILKQKRTELKTLLNNYSDIKKQFDVLQEKLFARCTLDTTTNQFCSYLLPNYQKGLLTHTMIDETIKNIIKTITAVESKQDCELPSSCLFPSYATIEFMKKKIVFTLESTNNIHLSNNCVQTNTTIKVK